jgi:hypothetical protein
MVEATTRTRFQLAHRASSNRWRTAGQVGDLAGMRDRGRDGEHQGADEAATDEPGDRVPAPWRTANPFSPGPCRVRFTAVSPSSNRTRTVRRASPRPDRLLSASGGAGRREGGIAVLKEQGAEAVGIGRRVFIRGPATTGALVGGLAVSAPALAREGRGAPARAGGRRPAPFSQGWASQPGRSASQLDTIADPTPAMQPRGRRRG